MPGSADETAAARYRPLLFSIAYGMTGSVGDAEDIVQDAFVGLTRARQAGTAVADLKAYLTTAVTRLGISYLSSARVRRETYVGDWLPEPVVVPAAPGPAEHAELADSLSMAFLVLLEALSPGGAGGVHAARGVRVRLPGRGQDHRQDRGQLPADLRPRQAAPCRWGAGLLDCFVPTTHHSAGRFGAAAGFSLFGNLNGLPVGRTMAGLLPQAYAGCEN